MIDVEALLAPVSEDSPCGSDLEYDAEFLALEQAVRGKGEQQFGDTVVAAEEPDWGSVRQRSLALLERTKDLRVATCLARSLARTEGVLGLGQGLQLLHGLCERYWGQVFPLLDPDDGDDPIMRMNAMAPLVHPEVGLRELRSAPCLRTRAATLTVRQVETVLGLSETPDASAPSEAEFGAVLRDALAADAGLGPGILQARTSANAFQSWLNEQVGVENSVDLKPLRTILVGLSKVVEQATPAAAPVEESGDMALEAGVAAEGGVARVQASGPGDLRNRDDVIRHIDRLIEFLERQEPTNPAPLFLRRARRLMTMNFLEIIEDMTPDSSSTIRNIAGIRE